MAESFGRNAVSCRRGIETVGRDARSDHGRVRRGRGPATEKNNRLMTINVSWQEGGF
jgi:hypothetical protein